MEMLGRTLSAFGPMIVGVVGVLLMSITTSTWQGKKRLTVMVLGPALTVTGMYLVLLFTAKVLDPHEGSGFLLGIGITVLSLCGAIVYYLICLITLIIKGFK